jgi:hypothetical protein
MSDMQDNTGQQPPSGGTPVPPAGPASAGPTQAAPAQSGATQTGTTRTDTGQPGHAAGDPAMTAGAASGDAARRAQATDERTGTATGTVPRPAPGYDDSQQYTGRHQAGPATSEPPSGAALGLTFMAAAFMMVAGVLGFFEGLAAVVRNNFFVVSPHYAFNWTSHAWGWTHIIIGAVVFVAGAALLTGKLWARMLGVLICSLSIIAQFLYLPYYPVWSIVVITLDALVIWALLTPRNPFAER